MLEGMIKSELKIIDADNGSIMHVLKNSDNGYKEFGEVYFSTIVKDTIKAWKLHKRMTPNLIVPAGTVLFSFILIPDHFLLLLILLYVMHLDNLTLNLRIVSFQQ